MSLSSFFRLPDDKVAFYSPQTPLFGKEVHEAFPSAVINVEEAGKCYAVGRYTACVFHLQGVMQSGLNALAETFGIKPSENRTWDAVLKKIDPELRKGFLERRDLFKTDEQFCAESAALLRAVKIAWRNPTMHVENIYDQEKALDVFNAVKGFMRHLARHISEKPKNQGISKDA